MAEEKDKTPKAKAPTIKGTTPPASDSASAVTKRLRELMGTQEEKKELDTSSLLSQAALAIAPALVGAAFGGTQGAAIGAKAGQTGVAKYQEVEKEAGEMDKEAYEKAKFVMGQEQRDKVAETGRKGLKLREKTHQLAVKKRAGALRKERTLHPTTKNSLLVNQAYKRIEKSAKDPSPAGDLALIFNYMKMLDPGSVVRESEFRAAAQAGSLPERAQAAFNKVSAGERLSEKMRKDFVDRSAMLFDAQMEAQKPVDDTYRRIAKKRGYDVRNIVMDFSSPEMQDALILMQAEEKAKSKSTGLGVQEANAVDRPELQDPVARKKYLEELRRQKAEQQTAQQRPITK